MKHRKQLKSFDMFIILSKWEMATAEVVSYFIVWQMVTFTVKNSLKLHTEGRCVSSSVATAQNILLKQFAFNLKGLLCYSLSPL